MLLYTSGLLFLRRRSGQGFHHASEPQHQEAIDFFHAAPVRITHSYILAEFIALTGARRLPRQEVLAFVADLQDNPLVEVIYVDEALHREAFAFLQQRLEVTWTLCDAISFLLMQQRGIAEALTTDSHFEQAGFIRLLHP